LRVFATISFSNLNPSYQRTVFIWDVVNKAKKGIFGRSVFGTLIYYLLHRTESDG